MDNSFSITPNGDWNNWKLVNGGSGSYNTVVPSSTVKFPFNGPRNDTSIITINPKNEMWSTSKFIDENPSFRPLPATNFRQIKPYLNNWLAVDTNNCIQFSMNINYKNDGWVKSPYTSNIQYCTVLKSGDILAINIWGTLWRGIVIDFASPIKWNKITLLPGMRVLKAYQLNDCVAVLTYELALYTTRDFTRWKYIEGTFGKVGSLLELQSPLSGYAIVCRAQPEYTLPVPENPQETIKNEKDEEILFKGKPITNEQASKAFEYAYPGTVKKMNEALVDPVDKVERAALRAGGSKAMSTAAEKILGQRFAEIKPPGVGGTFSKSNMKYQGMKNLKAMASQAAADLIFDNVPGAKDVFMIIFPDPVGSFLIENIYLLVQAVWLLAAPMALPATLPPFLVQVSIAIAMYAIEKNLEAIMKGLEDAANFIAAGVTNAYNDASRDITNAYNDASRDLTTAGLAVATGVTDAANDTVRDLKKATEEAEKVANEAKKAAEFAANEAKKEVERRAEDARRDLDRMANDARRDLENAGSQFVGGATTAVNAVGDFFNSLGF
jgi:hypothetical protein